MKKLLILIGAIAAYGQTVSISDTLTNAVGGGSYTGRITVTLNAPASAQPLYYSTTSLTGWQYVLCVGVTGTDCSGTTAAGVVTLTLYANSTITPAGTSYSARFTPSKGSPWTETWVVTPSTTTIRAMRATTVPTPTTTFQASQIVPGSNGQVLTTTAGASAWGSVPACATCVVTSGSYADPAWITSLAGSKVSGAVASATSATTATTATTATALAANGTNCAAGTFPLGVDASGNSESCTALPTTISGTANQITASASTGAVTLSLPATITGLTSVTSTGFTGSLTGNASTATALASSVTSGRLWIGQGTGVPTSDSVICADTTNHRLGVGTCSPSYRLDVSGDIRISAGNYLRMGNATSSDTFLVQSGSTLQVYKGDGSAFANVTAQAFAVQGTSSQYGINRRDTNAQAGAIYSASGALSFYSDTAGRDAMTIAATTGNLLIGGTTDDTVNKLQVTGDIKSTGISLGAAAATVEGIGFNRRVSDGVIFNSAHAATQFTNNNPTGTAMFEVYNGAGSFVGRSFGMFLASANSIVGAGNTSDGGYRLDITHSGSTGTLRVYDQTATTGSTLAVIQAGAGQSGNLMEWRNNAGTALGRIDQNGSAFLTAAIDITTSVWALQSNGLTQRAAGQIIWSSTSNYQGTADTGLARNAAGVLEINNGTAGTYRDLIARIHTWTNGTEATCSSTTRGQVVMVQGGAGVADTLRVCRKDAADAYAWTALY